MIPSWYRCSHPLYAHTCFICLRLVSGPVAHVRHRRASHACALRGSENTNLVPRDASFGWLYGAEALRLLPITRTGCGNVTRPVGGGVLGSSKGCGTSVRGPFPFPQGPLYFLTRPLAVALGASSKVSREAAATLDSAMASGSHWEPTLPWEDVFLGYALSLLGAEAIGGEGAGARWGGSAANAQGRLVAIDMGSAAWVESRAHLNATDADGPRNTLWVAPSTLVWHDKGHHFGGELRKAEKRLIGKLQAAGIAPKDPNRVIEVARFAGRSHCNIDLRRSEPLRCHPWKSCSGAGWLRCDSIPEETTIGKQKRRRGRVQGVEETRSGNCSTKLVMRDLGRLNLKQADSTANLNHSKDSHV